ncbi:hypothetical protein [Enterobacter hormaechei]|uniref:hypothetical protein n=1 Tax=Enterobacter hormaechei TaxID=158836 RepID=UPI000ADBF658
MYGNNEIISYLQANKILALKLDHAITGVSEQVIKQRLMAVNVHVAAVTLTGAFSH